MVRKGSNWETQFWSYLCTGNGMHCPHFSGCATRLKGGYCLDVDKNKFSQLIKSDDYFDATHFDDIRPYSEGIIYHIERLAEDRFGHCTATAELPVPTDLIQLVGDGYPVEIRTIDLRACYAATWLMPDGWVIQVSNAVSPRQKRVALFHEAFHIIAHNHCESPVFRKRETNQKSFNELLADYFAICALMPRKQVREQWITLQDMDRMVLAFDVPKSTMWLRLREMNLID